MVEWSYPGKVAARSEQPGRGDLGHRVAGRDEPDAAPVEAGDLADREDARVGCRALGVDDHAAARIDLEVGGAGELVARSHPDGEDDDIRVGVVAVAELEARARCRGRPGRDGS